MQIREKTRPNRLIDTIASNNGYRQSNVLFKLTESHTPNLEMLSHLKSTKLNIEVSCWVLLCPRP